MALFDDDYCREVSLAYWAEEEEFKAGTHPTQVRERIEDVLRKSDIHNPNITFLDWVPDECRVRVFIDEYYYGTFDYEENVFESTPGSRLQDTLEIIDLGAEAYANKVNRRLCNV